MRSDASQVTQILRQALAAVKDAGVPPELQPTALEKAVDLLAGAGASTGSPPLAQTEPVRREPGGTIGGGAVPLDMIAEGLGLSREVVEEVYHYDADDGLKIVLGTTRFARAMSAATKQLALLLAAGRQAAGIEEWTSFTDIRELAKEFGRFDSANFSTTIKDMPDAFMFKGSTTSDRSVKVNRRGREDAAAMITVLTGGERT
jgi:hypothetical protein